MKKIIDEIHDGKILLCDGAWGTQLIARGLKPGECPELWNVNRRHDVLEVARSYVHAGADIIETNSFGASPVNLDRYGLKNKAKELNIAAASISREAAGSEVHVAGSIGPSGKMLIFGEISESEMYESFAEQAVALEQGGADAAIIETMMDTTEMSLAVRAVHENTRLEIIASATYNRTPGGEFRTFMGASIENMVGSAISEGAVVVGANCGDGSDLMVGLISAIHLKYPDLPLIAQSNAGQPEMDGDSLVYSETPEYMASRAGEMINAGIGIIGGCCGTTPLHIKAIRDIIARHE